jgi:hypothetical protein
MACSLLDFLLARTDTQKANRTLGLTERLCCWEHYENLALRDLQSQKIKQSITPLQTGIMKIPLAKLNEIPQRLKKFVTHDVRKNPILGLYLVIGAMVVGYGIYFMVVMYKDLTRGEDKHLSSTPHVSQVRKAPDKQVVAENKKAAPPPDTPSSEQREPPVNKAAINKGAQGSQPTGEKKLDVSKWKTYQFRDGPRISIPPDWSVHEFSDEKHLINGVRLEVPDSNISLKCYHRFREARDHYPDILKETMKKGGYTDIKEQTKKIDHQEGVQVIGTLADKIMVVNIFELDSDKYFVARLIASQEEFDKLKSYYHTIVGSYQITSDSSTPALSIEKLEQQFEKSIEKKQQYLVGSTVWIKMKNGAKHSGVVIAEDDATLTLESFRFGGRYSFTVKKKDIVEIVR